MQTAAFVVSCLALVISGLALAVSNRAARHSKRSADAADAANQRAQRAEDRRRIDWSLQPAGEDRWQLTNTGTDTAFGVRIDSGGIDMYGRNDIDFPDGHPEPYLVLPDWDEARPDHLIVTWHHQADRSDSPRSRHLLL